MAIVDYLVVAGGGAGGTGTGGGGGGGGVRSASGYVVQIGSYTVTVGAGGTAHGAAASGDGANSVFDTITSTGGGGGGDNSGFKASGNAGGSGGGAAASNNTPGTGTASQGHDGGTGAGAPNFGAGGGGGGNTVGANGTTTTGGNGGAGTSSSITGASVTYGGGGGGGTFSGGTGGTGGAGGGGNHDANATVNTGGGGGGSSNNGTTPGNGGSGIVVISYITGAITATGGSISTSGGNTIHTFTASDTFQVTATGASLSPSTSRSPSASRSPSVSTSASQSPSMSPSASTSPSSSRSPSVSASASVSPSTSRSPSTSVSPSSSRSPSISTSSSASPSRSPSSSVSPSPGHIARVYVVINGVHYATDRIDLTKKILHETLQISLRKDGTPCTATFTAKGFLPSNGQEVRVQLGSDVIFAGTIQRAKQRYEGTPANYEVDCSCTDFTARLNAKKVTARFTQMSATNIVTYIIQNFAPPDFTLTNVVPALDVLDEITFTFQDVTDALAQLAKRIGAQWYCDFSKDIHFFITESSDTPTALTSAHDSLSEFAIERSIDQMLSRMLVEGYGSTVSVGASVGATSLAVEEVAPFDANGGYVVSGVNRISYSGISSGSSTVQGGSSTVLGRPGPAAAPGFAVSSDVTGGPPNPAGTLWNATYSNVYSDGFESVGSPYTGSIDPTPGGSTALLTLTLVVGDTNVTKRRCYLRPQSNPIESNRDLLNDNTTISFPMAFQWDSVLFPPSTPADYNTRLTVTSITRFGTTATVTTSGAHGLSDGQTVLTSGANESAYNGSFTITITSSTTFVYTVAGSPSTPATGTITTGVVPTYLYVTDTSSFSSSGGTVRVGGQTFTYTGRSTTSGTGALTGVSGMTARASVGDAITTITLAGSTTLPVNDTTAFSASGGSARVGGITFTYTGRSTSSGAGNLTGIPASGAGSLTADVNGGSTVLLGAGGGATLTGIPASGSGSITSTINVGDDVNLLEIVEDATAAGLLRAYYDPTGSKGFDGWVEDYIQDRRIGKDEARSRGQAVLSLRGHQEEEINYIDRDYLTRPGKTITVLLGSPFNVDDDYLIQDVTIDTFSENDELYPNFTTQASENKMTLEQLLRLARRHAGASLT